jgi:hypothetical protein
VPPFAGTIFIDRNIITSADPQFISTYARDNPMREDIAESFLTYLAVRFRAERLTLGLKYKIQQAIPNRISYFDALNLNMYPIVSNTEQEQGGE